MTAKDGPLPDESAAMSLPSDRAFVVQISISRGSEGGSPLRGRVEHVVSGRATHFGSARELCRFIEDLLREERSSNDA